MFQAYRIVCIPNSKHYIGITGRSLRTRWIEHISDARRKPRANALYKAILKHGAEQFTIESICSAFTWDDLCALEPLLIEQWRSLAPNGYNLSPGGEGRGFGFKPSAESVERSAAKHRGKPCHANTRKAAFERRGKRNSLIHNERIAVAKRGVKMSEETKTKLIKYWADRRASGAFKTVRPYEHIARTFKPF